MAKTNHTETLFPILPQPTGIARLASHAEHADDGHLIEFKSLEVRSILNKSVSKRLRWISWSINPYRGCEFGCKYCYARYTHEFLELRDPLAFERLIFLKQNAAWLLEQELRKIDPTDEIALGTATDPYQPIERRARITRSLLEVFARRRGHHLGIVTKSTLITRDIDLLTEIAKYNTLTLHITITTPNTELARLLEPRAPRPDLRFQTVQRLREAGLRTGILCCPLLPGITDTQEALNEMARRAAAADASFLAANPLFLKPCSRPTYLSFVREHFPSLVADYAKRFDHADFASPPYRQKLALMVEQARRLHGLSQRPLDVLPGDNARRPAKSSKPTVQQKLFA
ncbi:radical SAM protein [Edaphobacter paludis]|uniref:Radical SAM protein n=1 Tax=Edaphobacter paludis TaxID=3035702 RepID=A0AAU7D6C4_9BACT